MAIRDSMAPLIDKIRGMIGDTAGASQQFDNQAIQNALDVYRVFVRYAPLTADPSRLPGGGYNYDNFYARRSSGVLVGDWEEDATLYSPSYVQLAPSSSDTITGHWAFTIAPPGLVLPVLVKGQTYDIYGACADLCLKWAGALARAYDFSANGVSFRRGSQTQELRAMAAEYRKMQRPRVVTLIRSDMVGEGGGSTGAGVAGVPVGVMSLDW